MGTSIELHKKNELILSVEIDREVLIEISTGFSGPERKAHVNVGISVNLPELLKIIRDLNKIADDLSKSIVCKCGVILHKDEAICSVCEWTVDPRKD